MNIHENVYTWTAAFEVAYYLVTLNSVIAIIDFAIKKEVTNRTLYHLFSLFLITVYYTTGFLFVTSNKTFFDGYAFLSAGNCIKRYFTVADIYIIGKCLHVGAFICSFIYVIKNAQVYNLKKAAKRRTLIISRRAATENKPRITKKIY